MLFLTKKKSSETCKKIVAIFLLFFNKNILSNNNVIKVINYRDKMDKSNSFIMITVKMIIVKYYYLYYD